MTTTEFDRDSRRVIHVAHSPDSDDAFMFYGLASGAIDTEELEFEHELQGIQELNERAMRGELVRLRNDGILASGDTVVVTAALPFGAAEVTNTLRVERVP